MNMALFRLLGMNSLAPFWASARNRILVMRVQRVPGQLLEYVYCEIFRLSGGRCVFRVEGSGVNFELSRTYLRVRLKRRAKCEPIDQVR